MHLLKYIITVIGTFVILFQYNGVTSLGENIADNGGVKLAYQAYQFKNLSEPRLPGLENYSPQQMFWISTVNYWCQKHESDNVHLPDEIRVIGTLSNMPQFAKDFNCPIGSKMNPEKKCTVW